MNKSDRSKFIGGSDAAGVLGLSRWDTPLSIWAEKTGQFIKPEVENEASELGKELEDYVSRRFSRKTGKILTPANGTKFHPQYPFLGANIDRLVEGEKSGFEAKTCSSWKSKEWEGEEIPQEYIIQCYHYMMVTGFKKWYLAVLIGNQEFKIKELIWDDKIIADLEKREVFFWENFVMPKIMPMTIFKQDTDTLDGLFPQAEAGKVVRLTDEANILVEGIMASKQDLRALEGNLEALENQLKALIKENEIGQTSRYEIKWSNSKWSHVDSKLLKEAFPDIHKTVYKTKLIRKFSYKSREESNVKS